MNPGKEVHIVPNGITPTRLSDYTAGIFIQISSRKGMKKAIQKGAVWVNGQMASTGTWVKEGDTIELKTEQIKKRVFERNLDVVFEDNYLAVVHKPSGLLVNGNRFQTVENALNYNLTPSMMKDALTYPHVAHRLDYGTSGLLLVGKTSKALTACKQLFEHRNIQKTYRAITVGQMPSAGTINQEINAKKAVTHYKVTAFLPSKKYQQFNLVELYPLTGRRHQIRIHLANIGFPILGDRDYGTPHLWQMKRGLYLQAAALDFAHPFEHTACHFELPLPPKFRKLLNRSFVV